MAEPIQIDGPQGPLEADMIAVAGARQVVVIIPGSGPTDRDGNGGQSGLKSNAYKRLAESLAANGIASLRIDKRGMYGSRAAISDPNNVTIADYADDVEKWIARAGSIAPCVWLAGHSEGGLVALVAAKRAPDHLCGLILMATPGRPIGQILVEQLSAAPANHALIPDVKSIVGALESGRRVETELIALPLRALFAAELQPYLIDLFSYDPASIARSWHGPALILQGDSDVQIKPQDADMLQSALPQAERVNLHGGTHMLKSAIAGQPLATYVNPDLPLHPDVIPAMERVMDNNPDVLRR